jgi:hypothetical protein
MTLTYSPTLPDIFISEEKVEVPVVEVDDIISFDYVIRRGRRSQKLRHIGTVIAVHESGAITVKDHCVGTWSCFDPEHFDVRVIGNRK